MRVIWVSVQETSQARVHVSSQVEVYVASTLYLEGTSGVTYTCDYVKLLLFFRLFPVFMCQRRVCVGASQLEVDKLPPLSYQLHFLILICI